MRKKKILLHMRRGERLGKILKVKKA